MRLFLKYALGITFIALFLYAIISDFGMPKIPRKISLSYPAIQYEADDPSSVTETTVEIEGTYYRRLFQEPLFKGTIRIHNYPFTMEPGTDIELPLYRYDRFYEDPQAIHEGTLVAFLNYPTYTFNANGSIAGVKTESLGNLYVERYFEQIRIAIYPKPEDLEKRIYIAAPATNLEEASHILKYAELAE